MADNNKTSITLVADVQDVQQKLDQVAKKLGDVGSAGIESAEKINQGYTSAARGVRSISEQLESVQSTIAKGAAIGAFAASIGSMVSALNQAQQAGEKLKNSLEFSVGANNIASELEYLRNVTRKLGLDYTTAADSYAKFSASVKGSGVSLEQTRNIFEGVAQATAKFGLSAEDAQGVFLALSQMASKGVVSSEELRGQLAERLPGAMRIAAQAMGVTEREFSKMLETGQILASDFLPKFGQALKDGITAPMNSLTQEINRLNSAWDQWKQAFANSDGGGFKWLTNGLNESAAAMRRLGQDAGVVQKLLMAIGGFQFGAAGNGAFDTQRIQEQKMAELGSVVSQRNSLQAQQAKGSGYLNAFDKQTLGDLIRQEEQLRSELLKIAEQRGRELFKMPDIKGEYEAQQAKRKSAFDAYMKDVQTEKEKEVTKENERFAALTAVIGTSGKDYESALAAHKAKLADINKNSRDEYASLIQSIREKTAAEEAALGTSEKLTAGEKYALKVMVDLRDGTIKLTDAQKQATAAALERYLVAEKANEAERKAAEARKILLHFEEETSKIKVGTSNINEQISQLETYGAALKENAVAAAEASIAELNRKGVYDQAAESARMAAAVERQIADQRLSLTQRAIELGVDETAAISANYADQVAVERELVEAKKKAELAKIDLAVESAAFALKAAEANGTATDKMRTDFKALEDAAKKSRDSIASIASAKLSGLEAKNKNNIFDSLSASAEKFRKGLGGVVTALNAVQKAQDDSRYANDKTGNQQLQDQIAGYGQLAGSIKVMFKEKSDGYKAMEALEKGLTAAQLVLNTATAVGAVLNQGKGEPFSAWVRMAAMAAAVAAMGFSTGFIGGGGGGQDSAAAVAAQQASQGTGTVLGDAAKQSESIAKSLELLGDVDTMTMKYSSQMAASLRNIENNIGGFATMLFRSTSATSGNLPGLKLAPSYSTLQDYAGKITPGLNLDDQTNQMVDRLGADGTTSWLNPVGVDFTTQSGDMFGTPDVKALIMTERLQNATAGKLGIELPGVFESLTRSITAWVYGKVSQSIVNSGLDLGTGSVSAYANREVDLRQFATVETKKSQAFGLVKSSSTSNAYAPLDDEFTRQIGTIFSNLSLTLNAAAGALGEDTAKVGAEISSHIVSLGQISLKDMPLDKSIEAISAVLSTAFDKAASATFSQLTDFQQVGEGFYETVMRVATGVESAKVALERAGVSAINYSEIINKQGNVAEQVARQSISAKEGLSGIGALISGISGTASELVSVYTALLDLRAAMSGIGLAAADVTHDMIRGAGSLDALSSGFNDYLQNYFTDAEQLSAKTKMVSEQFTRLGVSMPSSRSAFVSMVNGLDRTTESGQRTFGVLMSLAGAFNEIMPAAESATAATETATEKASRIASERAGLEQEYRQLIGDTVSLRQQELSALDESNRALKERIWAIEDARAAEAAAKTALSTAFSRLQESVNAEKQRITVNAEQQKAAINTQLATQQEAYRTQISAAQDAANEIKSIASALSNAVKQTQIDSVLLDKQRLDVARGIIDQAYAGNNIKLPGLTDALAVAGEDSKKFYGTFEAYAFEQGVTNAKIKNLSGTADAQLSAAEQMIKSLEASSAAAQVIAKAQLDAIDTQTKDQQDALDAQLKQGEDQMNALLGIDKSVLSVADAVKGLAAAMAGYSAAQSAAQSAIRAVTGGGGASGGGASGGGASTAVSGGASNSYAAPTSMQGNWWDGGYWVDNTNTAHANVESSPWYAGPNSDRYYLNQAELTSVFGANNVPSTAYGQAYAGALSVADWNTVKASADPVATYRELFSKIVGITTGDWTGTGAGAGESGLGIYDSSGGIIGVLVGNSAQEIAANAMQYYNVGATGDIGLAAAEGIVASAISQYGAGTNETGMAIYESAVSLGLTASQIAEATGQTVEAINSWIDDRNLDPLDGSHATGLASVPFDGYRAELHKGEAVISAPEVAAIRRYFGATVGGGDGALLEELQALRKEVALLRQEAQATAQYTNKTARLLDRAMPDGDALATRVAA